MPMTKTLLIRGLLVFLALLLSSSVCFFGYLQKVPDSSYSGIRSMNASDFNANGAWLRQALDGKFIFRNPFTSEKQTPFLIRPFYSAISLPFRWANLSSPVILHIWRLIFSIILLASLFPLIKVFEKNQNRINIAFLLLAFTSGAGYFFHKIVPGSADLGLPEAFLFLTLGEAPHFQYSILLFWVAVAALFLYGENRRSALWVFLVCLGLLWWDHPFDAITLTALSSLAVMAVYRMAEKDYLLLTRISCFPSTCSLLCVANKTSIRSRRRRTKRTSISRIQRVRNCFSAFNTARDSRRYP